MERYQTALKKKKKLVLLLQLTVLLLAAALLVGIVVLFSPASAEAGNIASAKATVTADTVKTGDVMSFQFTTTYASAQASGEEHRMPDAIFALEFATSPENVQCVYMPGVLVDETDAEWQKIKVYLQNNPSLAYAQADDWEKIDLTGGKFCYYSSSHQVGLLHVEPGASVAMKALRFSFPNGVTPDGATMTLTPKILNQNEIAKSYRELRLEAGKTEAEIDRELETAFLETAPVSVTNTASFDWKPVFKKADLELGNIVGSEGVPDNITFDTKTQPTVKADESKGVLYTRKYTLQHSMRLEGGLYYDLSEKSWSVETTADSTKFLVDGQPLLTVNRPGLSITPQWSDLSNGESGEEKYLTGFDFTYSYENDSLTGATPAEAEYLDLRVQLHQVKQIRFDKPSEKVYGLRSTVEFHAYSIMGEETDPTETGDVKYKHVQSSDIVYLKEVAEHPLEKEAFHRYENGKLSEPANNSASYFQPNETVYYKITAYNDGSANRFVVEDRLPEGLKDIQLLAARKNGEDVTEWGSKFFLSEDGMSFTYHTDQIIAGEYGELIFSAKIKSKAELVEQGLSALKNTAKWAFAETPGKTLDSVECTINVNLGISEASKLKIEKSSSTAGNTPAFGQEVTYTIRLTNSSSTDQFVTVTDFWPEGILLKRYEKLRPGGTIKLLDEAGKVLYTYTNTSSINQAANISKEIASKTHKVQFNNICVSSKGVWELMLKGSMQTTGSVTNKAEIDTGGAGNNPSAEVTTNSLALSIEKSAMRIKGADANAGNWGATEQVNSSGSSPLFVAGDVVCYDVRVKNNDTKMQRGITLTDTLPASLQDAVNVTGQTLSPADSSIQVLRKQGGGQFEPIANAAFSGGVLTVSGLEIPAGRTDTFRFYFRIPQSAVQSDGTATTHINQAQVSIVHSGQKLTITASCPIITQVLTVQTASVEKSIVFTAKTFGSTNRVTGAIVPKSGEIPAVNQGDYVFYRLAITNTSKTDLKIWDLKDWLPDGMTFVSATNYDGLTELVKNLKADGTSSCGSHFVQLKLDGTASSALMLQSVKPDGTRVGGAAQKSLFVNAAENSCTFSNGKQAWLLPAGYTLPIGIMAQVTDGGALDDPAINKAGSRVLSSVDVTPGDTVTKAEHVDDTYQYLTDTAVVTSAPYTPGISKVLYQYQAGGTWGTYTEGDTSMISPSEPLRWRLNLQNGTNGTQTCGDIKVYTVTDTLPLGFAYQGGSLLVNSSGASHSLPDPQMSKNADGQNVLTWKLGDTNGDGEISGGEIDLQGFSYSLPAGDSLILQFDTQWDREYSLSAKYGTYVNRADLTPAPQYSFTQACAGELDNKENPTSVWAVEQIDLIGGGQTKSWKTITNEKNETGRGDTPQNNQVTAMPGETLVYTLNIESQIQNGKVQDLVIIDRLPAAGDTGVTNRIPRQSDFLVRFADVPAITVTHTFADGSSIMLQEGTHYFVQFGKWAELTAEDYGLLPTRDWRPMNVAGYGRLQTDGTRWVNMADITDFSGYDCIRIQRVNDLTLSAEDQSGSTLTVSYRAQIPKNGGIFANNIAWNSFGYSYNISNYPEMGYIVVGPPRVGVRIPAAQLKVTKLLQEGNQDDQPFHFRLEQSADGRTWLPAAGIAYTISGGSGLKTGADGSFTLTRDQTAVFSVLPGYHYRVTEAEIPPGYGRPTVTATDVPGGQTAEVSGTVFTAIPTLDFTPGVTFTNHKGLHMAETGGRGILPFLLAGVLLIGTGAVLAVFVYRKSKK